MINIRRVEHIYSKEFYTVDVLDGVSKIRTLLSEIENGISKIRSL